MADPSRPVPSYQFTNMTANTVGTEVFGRGGQYGAQMAQQQLPDLLEMARNGWLYVLSAGVVANAKAPVTDFGTTTAAWALYNGNLTTVSPGYCVIPIVISVHLASGTADTGASLLLGMSSAAQGSALTNATGVVGPKCTTPTQSRASLATLTGAATLAGAPAWMPWGSMQNAASTTPGTGLFIYPAGAYIIQPTYALGMTVLSGAGTTAKYAVSVLYAELPTTCVS